MKAAMILFCRGVVAVALAFAPLAAIAADYPTKPIRMIVPFTAGSASDILARTVSTPLSAKWGQPVIIDNRPGAGGTIGTGLAAKSPPDGHTLVVVSAGHVVNPVMYSRLPYDTLRDFSGVIPLANLPSVLAVSKSSNVRTVRDLVAIAKSKAGQLNYVSGGIGSASHVNAEKFKAAAGIDVTHIPLKGAGDMLTEIIGGRAEYGFLPLIAAAPFIREQKVTALAISSAKRASAFPELPTIAEAGVPGAQFVFWIGLLAPAKTPRPIVQKLNAEIGNLLAQPETRERLRGLGAEPMPMSPEAFDGFMRREFNELGHLMRAAGVKAE
jgi:tripartite-type tricarboxylate transporter receptor subunit TctC